MGAKDSQATRSGEATGFSDFNLSFPWLAYGPDWRTDWFSGFGYTVPPYFLDSYKRGEVLPVYLDYHQLKIIRDRSRRLCAENEFAIAAIRNRQAYLFGTGFRYRVIPVGDHVDEHIVQSAQRVIDVFSRVNRLSRLEREASLRCDRDGEAFIRCFPRDTGLLELRWIEPEHIRPPGGNSYEPKHTLGIETKPDDVQTVRGYWVVLDPIHTGWTPEFVKAEFVNHIRTNTDSGAKRGLPLFYPVEANLRRAEELQAAMTSTAKARAKIAMIRKMEGSTRAAAERLKSEVETGQMIDPATGVITNVEEMKYGTVLTSSKNMEYEFPKDAGVSNVVEILKCELRSIAAMLVMPESALTADPSGGTYSSQLVAEAPATRNYEALQKFYRDEFAEDRDSLCWKQIRHAVKVGLLDNDTLNQIEIVAHAPNIVARDPDKAAAAQKTYLDMGSTSPQQVCSDLGLNWKQIQAEREEAGIPSPQELMQMQSGVGAPPEPGDEDGEVPEFEFDSSEFE